MGHMVIACYRPRPGREDELLQLVREHVPILRREGLATARPPVAMRAADGTVIELFEWASQEAVERAHDNPRVQALWQRFGELSEFARLGELAEAHETFAHFAPLD